MYALHNIFRFLKVTVQRWPGWTCPHCYLTLCMCLFASGCFIYSTTYYSNVCCTCLNMGDKRNPALILDSTYMQNCPSCYHRIGNTADIMLILSCWTNMWNDNYTWTTELRKVNMRTLVRPSLYRCAIIMSAVLPSVHRVTRIPPCYAHSAVLLSLSLSVILDIFSIGKMKLFLYTGNCISK